MSSFNDDTQVDVIDLGELRTAFDSLDGDGRYVAREDLNANANINIIDIGALRPLLNKSCTP